LKAGSLFFCTFFVTAAALQRKFRLLPVLLFAICLILGAVISLLLGSFFEKQISGILSFATSLLYLAIEELRKKAHESKETIWNVAFLFLGFFFIFFYGMT
jgi:hypothetical protein